MSLGKNINYFLVIIYLKVGLETLDEESDLLQVDVDPVLEGVSLKFFTLRKSSL